MIDHLPAPQSTVSDRHVFDRKLLLADCLSRPSLSVSLTHTHTHTHIHTHTCIVSHYPFIVFPTWSTGSTQAPGGHTHTHTHRERHTRHHHHHHTSPQHTTL